MPRSEDDDDASDSVDEDAELELSCALHDLAERVKTFEETMTSRLRISRLACGLDDDDDDGEEIGEDIPEVDDDHVGGGYGYASPKKQARRRRGVGAKRSQAKQQDDSDDDEDDMGENDDNEEEEEEEEEAKGTARLNNAASEWDERNERAELSEMKHNISKLLQGFKEQAKALEASTQ